MRIVYTVACVLLSVVKLNSMDFQEITLDDTCKKLGSFNVSDKIPLSVTVETPIQYDGDYGFKGYNIRRLIFKNYKFDNIFGFSFLSGLPIETIIITKCELTSEKLEGLFGYLGVNALEHIDLSGNSLNNDEEILFESLHNACAYKFGLKYLNLQDNGLSAKTIKKIKEDPDISSIPELRI